MTSVSRWQYKALLLSSTLFATTPALADADADSQSPRTAEIVVTGSVQNHQPSQASLDATQPTSIVAQKFVQDIVPVTGDYSQTIKFTPSFSFSAPNGAGGSESKSQVLRGFADGQYNVSMDGIPFGDANDFTHHTTSFFPSGVLGDVVVDRGPGDASTIGYATFGGTIGLHSRVLADKMSGMVRGSYGSFNDRSVMTELQSGTIARTGGTRILFDYLYHKTDGALDYAGLKTRQGVIKLSQPLGGTWTLDVFGSINNTYYNGWNPITPNQLAIYGKSFGALNNDPRSSLYKGYNYKTKKVDFEYLDLRGSALGFDIQNKLYTFYYRNREYDSPNPIDLGLPPTVQNVNYGSLGGPAGNLDILSNSQGNSYRSFGDILNVSHDVRAGLLSGTLHTGLWWEHQNQDRDSYFINVSRGRVLDAAAGVDPYSFRGKNALGQTGKGAYLLRIHANIDTLQPFIEYAWSPVDGVIITPGFKHVDFTRTHDAPVNQGTLLPLEYKQTYSANLLSAAANWKINGQNAAYAQVAQGFLAPNVSVFYTNSLSKNNFKPQRTTNYQVGFVHKGRVLTFDVDGYYIDFNNYITTATDFTVTPNQTYSINGGGVIYKGVEAQASVALGYGLSVFAAGSINSAKTKGSNKMNGENLWVAGAPDSTLSAGLLYDNGPFYGAMLAKRTGGRYFGANKTNLHLVDGSMVPTAAAEIVDPATGKSYTSNHLGAFATADLTLGYRFDNAVIGASMKFELQVQNLFDNRNATDTNGRLAKGDAIDPAATTYTYSPPRAISGSLTVGF